MPIINQTVHHASGTYVAGDELPDDHELVRQSPELFDGVAQIERATSAPGEKRATKRPAKPKG
jgi:hypothetical protein